jgi:hypothetical protein
VAVRCPCKDRCQGYSPYYPSDCELVGQPKSIPERFANKVGGYVGEGMRNADGFMATLLTGLVGGGTAAWVLKNADHFEVWECPECKCEVCYAVLDDSTRNVIAEIADC